MYWLCQSLVEYCCLHSSKSSNCKHGCLPLTKALILWQSVGRRLLSFETRYSSGCPWIMMSSLSLLNARRYVLLYPAYSSVVYCFDFFSWVGVAYAYVYICGGQGSKSRVFFYFFYFLSTFETGSYTATRACLETELIGPWVSGTLLSSAPQCWGYRSRLPPLFLIKYISCGFMFLDVLVRTLFS